MVCQIWKCTACMSRRQWGNGYHEAEVKLSNANGGPLQPIHVESRQFTLLCQACGKMTTHTPDGTEPGIWKSVRTELSEFGNNVIDFRRQ